MRARRPTSALVLPLCLLLACAGAAAAAPATTAAIVASARLRQGDPLLAWVIAPAEAAALELRLVDAGGALALRARCFPAAALLGSEPPPGADAEPGAGTPGPLAPPPPPRASTLPDRSLLGALMALPLDLAPGAYELLLAPAAAPAGAAGGTAEVYARVALAVDPRSFPSETIKLDEANARLLSQPSARKQEEARRLYALLNRIDDGALFASGSPLLFPAQGGTKSAGFGDARRYLYPDGGTGRSVHAGIDWAVVSGTIVRACARGKVVLIADREVTGETLVLEHLPGLYSLYFHLSSIGVAEGEVVERGDRIALSGSSGMSTGPHLHWELRAKGEAVDPELWLGSALLDKGAVAAIMYGLIEGR